jgi:diacylglycerol O-acyltransferase / wax synthase
MRYLSGADTQMLYADTAKAMNVIAPVIILDPATAPGGRVTYDDVLGYVGARLHLSTTFRERLVRVPLGLDRPAWINDESFDLEYHVRELALPAPGDWRQFTTQVARIGSRPLDLSRPPWELYIVHGLNGIPGIPENSFAIMLRLHHAAIDGVSGAELVTALMQPAPDSPVEPPKEEWKPEQPPSWPGMLVRGGVRTVVRPVGSARQILGAVGALPGAMTRIARPAPGAPKLGASTVTRFNKPVSAHRVWDFVRFDLTEVKEIKNAVSGVTVNDVAVAVVGGALRRYLTDKGELPETTLNAVMPISTRPTARQGSESLSGGGGGNRFVMTMIPIGTDVADPLERVRSVQKATEHAKAYGTGMASLLETAELIPGALIGTMQRALVRATASVGRAGGAHVVVTNVPGPRVPMYFAGARGVTLSGMTPVSDGMALVIAVGGYLDDFSVMFTGDRDALPDPAFFSDCLRAEFEALSGQALPHEGNAPSAASAEGQDAAP